jgi:predicted RND superfamily exporter protein
VSSIARTIDALIRRLAALQIARPRTVLGVAAVVALVAAAIAARLELQTRYDQLLPRGAESAVELEHLSKHTKAAQTILVVLDGDDTATLRALGDAIVPKLRALGPDVISSADDGVQQGRAYLMRRAGLFLPRAKLEKLKADVDERWDREVAKQTGESLDDDDDTGSKFTTDDMRKRLRDAGGDRDRYPDGYYQTKDGKTVVVIAHSPAPAGDLVRAREVVDRVKAEVHGVAASRPSFAKVRIAYAGDMIAGLDEYGAVRADLLDVGATGVLLVLAVVMLYFMRVRALVVMGASVGVGLALTFGLTRLAIGHLNVATGFLFSIVAGNGINAGIIYLARYHEERRAGASVEGAVRTAHATTWPATAMAALAAAASYGSLGITRFRAFHEFAFIGAAGMIACWIATITVAPALLLLLDARAKPPRRGAPYGDVFAFLVTRFARPLAALGFLVAVVGTIACAGYVRSKPIEYNLKKIQTDQPNTEVRNRAWDRATQVLGQFPQAAVVLTPSPKDSREVAAALTKRWDKTPVATRPIGPVHSIWDFVPGDQEAKLPTLLALGARIRRARELKMLKDDEWKLLEPLLPPPDLKPYGIADLPPELAGPFTEKDGTRGTLVLIEPAPGQSGDDLHYLLRYAAAFREIHLPDGTVVHGSGRAVVFADILKTVVRDIPRAVALSLAMTAFAVLVALGRTKKTASVLGALFVGAAGVALFLLLDHVRINFLNFAALPITFGIGVDYAVNVMQRHGETEGADIAHTLRTSGGAVVLCSLTTTLGYLALIRSHNQAIRSFGVIAVVGEISCLLAAMLVLPALWRLRLTGRATGGKVPPP